MNNTYSRADKIEWLEQTCGQDFIQNHLMMEMVNWMGEREFEAFYDHLCQVWEIKRDPNDPKFDPEHDSME